MIEFDVAGTRFELVQDEGAFHANPSSMMALPAALVCGISSASYQFPDQKQALLDALSPFQIVSKYWSTMALNIILEFDPDAEHVVYVGSWFGQQSAMATRTVMNYTNYGVDLVDKDPVACRIAQFLIKADPYHARCDPLVRTADIFDLSHKYRAGTVFVWNGLEHFDNNDVETFLEKNTESTFIFQSTSMEAADHTNCAGHIDDLLSCLPVGWEDGIVYRGEIQCDLGSRYMLVVRGPGCDPLDDDEDESDGLDSPNR